MLWVGHQDKPAKLTEFARKTGLPDYLYDGDDSMSKKYGMTYGAGLVFINREGIVKSRTGKGISAAAFEAELKKIL